MVRGFPRNKFFISIKILIFLFRISFVFSDEIKMLKFNSQHYRAGHFAFNSKGDMFIEYSYKNHRLFFGLKKNGKYYFSDEEGNEIPTKEMQIGSDEDSGKRYESQNIFVSLKISGDKQYLFSIGTYVSVAELHDLDTGNYVYEPTDQLLGNGIYSYIFTLEEIINDDDEKKYLLTYINDKKYILQLLSFNQFSLSNVTIDSNYGSATLSFDIRIVSSFIMDSRIVLFYIDDSRYYKLIIFKFDLTLNGYADIDQLNDFNEGIGIFSKSFHLRDYFAIFLYYKGLGTSSLRLKIGTLDTTNSFTEKFSKDLNQYFFHTSTLLNDFVKLNSERFFFVAFKETTLSELTILLFDFYNDYHNLKIREYQVSFDNIQASSEIVGNIFNDLFVFSSSVNITGTQNEFSIFMMFGYANGTDISIDISEYFMDDNPTNENNIITKLTENIIIDNNIFGYELDTNNVKISLIPEEILFYNSNNVNIKIENNDTLNKNYIFKQNEEIVKTNKYYYLNYQLIIKEPDYDTFITYPISISNYSESLQFQNEDQKTYFSPKIFYGRANTLKFKLCHSFCGNCSKYGTSDNNPLCLTCLEEYQYGFNSDDSSNCIPEGYFYDKNSGKLVLCDNTNSKHYINITNIKTICFNSIYPCPDEYPYYIDSTKECHNHPPPSTILTTLIETTIADIITTIPSSSIHSSIPFIIPSSSIPFDIPSTTQSNN